MYGIVIPKGDKKGKGKLDMKTGLLAASLKEKVQPDMDDLSGNMEENEEEQKKEEEKKEEPKLGNLSYKFEYDFQKGEVCIYGTFIRGRENLSRN